MFFSFIPLLVIIFPFAELYLFFRWLEASPIIALLYMLATMAAGVGCIKLAKVGILEFLRRARDGGTNKRAIILFGKLWIIGILLFFPGYLTDLVAAAVWLLSAKTKPPPDDGVVEIQSHFIDEDDKR